MSDKKAPDGLIYYGDRKVRSGGRIKFGGCWWQHPRLIPFANSVLGVRGEDYWMTKITIWDPSYPEGKYLFKIESKKS
jgi:hypothetical protein